jgi:hypothetical protein
MRKLLATLGAILGITALVAVTSPIGTAVLAGIALRGID